MAIVVRCGDNPCSCCNVIIERQIFLTRHGESTDNIVERIGGDAPVRFNVAIWTETLRSIQHYVLNL